jgi:hypothetical protein
VLVRSGHVLTAQEIAAADAVYDDLAACAGDLLSRIPHTRGMD